MAELNFKQTHVWGEAIELSLAVYNLSEELPSEEDGALTVDLRHSAVDIPAAAASDIIAGSDARLDPVLRLQTQLELIRRIYPALDTGKVDEQVTKLYARLTSAAFSEVLPPPPVPAADEPPEAVDAQPETADDQPEA